MEEDIFKKFDLARLSVNLVDDCEDLLKDIFIRKETRKTGEDAMTNLVETSGERLRGERELFCGARVPFCGASKTLFEDSESLDSISSQERGETVCPGERNLSEYFSVIQSSVRILVAFLNQDKTFRKLDKQIKVFFF